MISIFLWYVAGNFVVVLLGYIIYLRFAPGWPNLGKRLKRVLQVRDRKKRIEAAKLEIRNSEAEQKQLEDEIKVLEGLICSRVQVQEDGSDWAEWMFLALAIFLIYLDSGVFLLLSAGSHLLQFSAKVWAFAAFGVAVSTQLVLHVALKLPVFVPDRPEATRRRAELGTCITVICVAASIYLTLAGRNISDPGALEATVETGLLGLVLFAAVSGAFAWWAWSSYFHERRAARELRRAQHLHEAYDRHLEHLKDDLDRTKGGGPGFSTLGAITAMSFLALILTPMPWLLAHSHSGGIILAAHFNDTRLVKTGSPRVRIDQLKPISVVKPVVHRGLTRFGGCGFALDVSASDNGPDLKATVDALGANLPLIASTFDCARLRVTSFAADVFPPIREVNLPSVSDPANACPSGQEPAASGLQGIVKKLYPVFAQNVRQDQRRSCDVQRDAVNKGLVGKREAALRRAATILRAAGQHPPAGPCTAVFQVIGRALQWSQTVIAVSDFNQTCAPPPSPIPIPPGSELILVVISPRRKIGRNTTNDLLAHIASLQKAFPTAIVVLAPEATPDFWRALDFAKGAGSPSTSIN